jgi:hypothetical protein
LREEVLQDRATGVVGQLGRTFGQLWGRDAEVEALACKAGLSGFESHRYLHLSLDSFIQQRKHALVRRRPSLQASLVFDNFKPMKTRSRFNQFDFVVEGLHGFQDLALRSNAPGTCNDLYQLQQRTELHAK